MGISALIAAVTDFIAAPIAAGAGALGVGAETAGIIGGIGAGAIEGAGLGAGEAAITGGDPGKGALAGGITGGAISGLAGPIGSAVGSTTAGDVLAGGLGGLAGAAATGGNLGTGALGGAGSGLVSAALSPTPTSTTGAAPQGGGASSAGATAAPASVAPGAASPDATANFNATAFENASVEGMGATGSQVGPGSGGVTGATAPVTPVQTGALPDLTPAAGANLQSTAGQTNLGGGAGGGTAGGASTGSLASANTPGTVGTGAAGGTTSATAGLDPVQVTPSQITPAEAAAAGPTTSVGKFLENPSVSGAWDVVKSNPLQTLAGGALAYDILKGNQSYPGQGQIGTAAQQALASGNQLQSYLSSGQLPPGLQAQINSATQAAQASVRQQYANRGMSGSSAEAQDLQNIQQQAAAQTGQLALQLFQQGTNETELGTQLYGELMNVAMRQDQQLSSGITNFVSALAGISRPIVLTPTGTLT